MSRYHFVEEPGSLVDVLQHRGQLGIDTEFMRERTYYAQLCLTQIAAGDDIWCVDPLAGHPQDENGLQRNPDLLHLLNDEQGWLRGHR